MLRSRECRRRVGGGRLLEGDAGLSFFFFSALKNGLCIVGLGGGDGSGFGCGTAYPACYCMGGVCPFFFHSLCLNCGWCWDHRWFVVEVLCGGGMYRYPEWS